VKITIVAVGQQMPTWAQAAYEEYARRFGQELKVELKTVKIEPRPRSSTPSSAHTAKLMAAERERILAALPRNAHQVVLDERGQRLTTVALAHTLQHWQREGKDVALIIGGPDGLDAALKHGAAQSLRLSDLTLPHALARVLLIEQLYRAWAINIGHPYHRS